MAKPPERRHNNVPLSSLSLGIIIRNNCYGLHKDWHFHLLKRYLKSPDSRGYLTKSNKLPFE